MKRSRERSSAAEVLEPRVLFAAVDLDPSFSGDGKLVTDFFGGDDTARAVAVQSDGKVVVAGEAAMTVLGEPRFVFAAARYNRDGTLDDGGPSDATPGDRFGANGRVAYASQDAAAAYALVIQKDGKIVLAGVSSRFGIAGTTTRWQFMRLNRDGSLDSSFGSGGQSSAFGNTVSTLGGITLQPDGKIVAVGGQNQNFVVARLTANGSFDPDFGGGGFVFSDWGSGEDTAAAVALDNVGNLVVVGTVQSGRIGVARYRPNGARDNTFDADGLNVVTGMGIGPADGLSVGIRRGGDIIAGGALRGDEDAAMYGAFRNDGRLIGIQINPMAETYAGIAFTINDRLILGGTETTSGSPRDFMLWDDNATDAGTRQRVVDLGGGVNDFGLAVARAPDGKMVQAGYTLFGGGRRNFAVTRHTGVAAGTVGTVSGQVFRDLDGDGVKDANEAGMANVLVYVDADNDGVFDKNNRNGERDVLTDATGNYRIDGLPPGTHRLRQVVPLNFSQSLPRADAYVVTVAAGQTVTGRNFGNKPFSTQGTGTAISGSVYHDLNGNGVRDVGNGTTSTGGTAEPDLAGRTVYLDRNKNGVPDGTEPRRTTDAAGNYLFEGIAGGTYRVRDVLPSGWSHTNPSAGYLDVTVANGQRVTGKRFGTLAPDPDDTIAEANTKPGSTVAVGSSVSFSISNPKDVDVIRFTVRAGQRVGFDVDRASGGTLNSYTRLFNASGTQITANDNGVAPGETGNSADSYLARTFTVAGTYYLGVSNNGNKTYNPTTGGGDTGGGSIGGYKLTLTNLPASGVAAGYRFEGLFASRTDDEAEGRAAGPWS